MNFLNLQHAPVNSPRTVSEDEALALRRKQDALIAAGRKERPAYLAKWLRRHPNPVT